MTHSDILWSIISKQLTDLDEAAKTLLAGLAAFAGMATFVVRGLAQQPAAPQAQADEPNPADAAPQPFNPQVAALMSMLIQPRHAKVALAGKTENWALAGYEFKQLQQGFQVIGRAAPRYKGLPVGELIDAALKQPFAVLDFAGPVIDIRYRDDGGNETRTERI